MKTISEFTDKLGFIGHFSKNGDWDFGDSLQRTATAYLERFVRFPELREENGDAFAKIIRQVSIMEDGEVQYVRHPDSTMWWGQPWTMSRDNLDTAHDVLMLYSDYSTEARAEWQRMTDIIIERAGLMWNTRHIWPKPDQAEKIIGDIIWPWNLAQKVIRGQRAWYVYPWLMVLDLDTLFNSIFRVVKCAVNPNNTGGCINHLNRMAIKQLRYPTITNWIAKWLWKLLRRNPKLKVKPKTIKALRVLQAYYHDRDKHPPMYNVMQTTAKELL
jgi:hypothetical protein